MNNVTSLRLSASPPLIQAAGPRAQTRFFEFFMSNIRNPNTRRAYARAIGDFLAWCEEQGAASSAEVQPLHVGAYVQILTRDRAIDRQSPAPGQRLGDDSAPRQGRRPQVARRQSYFPSHGCHRLPEERRHA